MTFPNFPDKYNSKPVFSPNDSENYRSRIGRGFMEKKPDGIILSYASQLIDYVTSSYETTCLNAWYDSKLYMVESGDKRIGLIYVSGFGAPIAVSITEQLIGLGIKQFINIGIAGTLRRDIQIGDVVVCDSAVRDEGTSHHYEKPSRFAYASANITDRIVHQLEKDNIKFHKGATWTIDAPYRETEDEVKHYQSEGVLTVDMEASALFVLGSHRGVETGSLFTVSDSLADLEWKPEFHADNTRKGLETIFTVALKVLAE